MENCRGLPDVVVKTACQIAPIPGLCPDGGDGGPLPVPSIPGLPLGGLGLGRAGPDGLKENMTLDGMMDTYDPILVALLLPGVAR